MTDKCGLKVSDIQYVKPLKGDHKAICVTLMYNGNKRGPGYWKLNNSVLKQEAYVNGVKEVISSTLSQYESVQSKRMLWEILKINIKDFSIRYCIKQKRDLRKREFELQKKVNKLNELAERPNSDHIGQTLIVDEKCEAETELHQLYELRVKGAQIRSRAKWIEEGEKSSSYFLSLEKQRQNNNVISRLKTDKGDTISNDNEILGEITFFYKSLYTSTNVNEEEIRSYLEKCKVTGLSDNDKQLCDQAIDIKEIQHAIEHLKVNKSPGLDGLTPEFYKALSEDVIKPMHEMIMETYREGELPDSMRKAVVTLIYKKGDGMKLENYRPISLNNYDVKIVAFILATRLQRVIKTIINSNQTAYIKKRFIGTNARLIQDIFEMCENEQQPGIILGLDFMKAYDSLEWSFMLKVLEKFNFGDNFIRWIKILYTKTSMSIKNNGWLTAELFPERGVRQGCPVSCLLFILAVEVLAQQIRDNINIKGIKVNRHEHKISQYADDSYLLLSEIESIHEAIQTINEFSSLAGPKLNIAKTKGIWLGPYKGQYPNEVYGITFIETPLRVLGIYIGHDKAACYKKNWVDKLECIDKLLERWKQRGLTILGKVLIVKALIIPKLVHNFTLLKTPDGILARIEKVLYKYIWNKKERIKRNTIISGIDKGGISMVDTMCKNMSIKAAWVNRILEGGEWTNIFNWYLEKAGVDIDYVLKMDVKQTEDCELFVKLPEFYQEVLTSFNACKTTKNANVMSTHEYLSSPIMGNNIIRHKGKCLYMKRWVDSGLKYVKDLYDENGHFIDTNVLLDRLNDKSNWIAEYAIVRNAVKKYIAMFDVKMAKYINIKQMKNIVHRNKFYEVSSLGSKLYYEMLVSKKCKRSHMESVWSKEFDIVNHNTIWSHIYCRNIKYFPINKVAEFKYKILQNTLYAGYMVNKWDKTCSAFCKYCGQLETTKHLLWECERVKNIWQEISKCIKVDITWK